MKIILIEDIDNLGKKGKILEVKKGFARNYLLPQGKALPATEENLHFFKLKEDKETRLKNRQKEDARELADKLSKLSLTLPCEAKDNEELFGSVNAKSISSALEEEGFNIEKEKILLEEPIKKLGIYNIKIKLLSEVEAEFKLWVV